MLTTLLSQMRKKEKKNLEKLNDMTKVIQLMSGL